MTRRGLLLFGLMSVIWGIPFTRRDRPPARGSVTLDGADHRALALLAAASADEVLPLFEESAPDDGRPREAIEAARAWARGEITIAVARAAAFAAHAAARGVDDPAARAAARAAGHAATTAHVATHARHAAAYADAARAASVINRRRIR